MITREHYEKLFADYPDVVSLKEFRLMLGGITEKTALKILEQGKVKLFFMQHEMEYTPFLHDLGIIRNGEGVATSILDML